MPKRTFNRLDDDKKERVMRAAIQEFQACGFEKAENRTIAQNAEVAKGTSISTLTIKKSCFIFRYMGAGSIFMKVIDRQLHGRIWTSMNTFFPEAVNVLNC